MATALRVWMNGEAVGLWTEGRGSAVFRYDEAWWRSANVRALSLSLPLTPGAAEIRGPSVTHYFDNLLPDSEAIRTRLRTRFGVASRTSIDLLRAFGLSVAPTSIGRFGAQRVLVVERFDRRLIGQGVPAWIARLPQEDFCQATGTPPDRKYEADGGPTMGRCLDLLSGSARAQEDRGHFLRTQLAFWLLAATDGHAKNFSLFHQRGGGFRLTPLYDVLSAWPILGEGADRISPHRARLAMAVRTRSAHHRLREVQTRHWHALALSVGGEALWAELVSMVDRVEQAVAAVERERPADLSAALWDTVTAGLRAQAARFRRGLTAG